MKFRSKRIAQQQGVAYKKGDKDGLAGWFKILGQVGLGTCDWSYLMFNDNTKACREYIGKPGANETVKDVKYMVKTRYFVEANEPITTIPFVKSHEFNYAKLLPTSIQGLYMVLVCADCNIYCNSCFKWRKYYGWIGWIGHGGQCNDWIGLGIFAYASGNLLLADYLNIMYIPNLGELSIFIAALVGACIGFLWYNSYPAQVFMGDTGSLTLGGMIAALAIIVRKELLIPIFCGVFLVEVLSVMLQVSYFKYTRKKYGEGRRIFLMSPLHHHYQKLGYHESKIVTRFWIVTILCVVFSIVTLKIR